jgi:hypothetical protein
VQSKAAQQQANDQAQADWQRQSDATIEDARRKALTGLDRDGNPLPAPAPPVQVARSDSQPVFTIETSPPATPTVTTNPPVFSGDTRPQGDPPVVNTNPPELPGPQPATPTLPDPVRGEEPLAPPVPAPTQGTDLPAPISPQPNVVPPLIAPPVQLATQNDTLRTGPAPSNPVTLPAPEPVNRPAAPIQPAVDVAGRPPVTPQQVSSPAVPNIPTGLYPTNPGELAQPIPLGWSAVSGATRYRLTVKNQTTGGFPVDDIYINSNGYTVQNLPAGTSFTWDVAACNQAGCSTRSTNGNFRTGGTPSASGTSDSQCGQITRYQQAIIDGYYGLEQQRGATKPNQVVLCRWQQLGTLDANLIDFQRSITAAANSGPNLPPAERRRIAREAVINSPLVQKAVSDLYYKIGEDYATKGVRSQLPSEANFLASAIRFVNGGFDQIEQNRNESYVMRSVSNINYMASYMVNQISGYYTKRIGIDIPASKLINLSGTAIGVYADAYVSGQK